MAPKQHKSTPARNPFQGSRSSCSVPPIPSHIRLCDEKAKTDFFKNFQARGVHSEFQVILLDFFDTTLPNVIRTRGWKSLCEKPVRCPVMFIQQFYSNIHDIDTSVPQFVFTFKGTRIVVTLDLISEVLHIPKVAHPNYPGCEHFWTMSKDDLISHFCGTLSIWGGKLNTPCLGFAKGPRFLNIVMTFTLTPLSHYNTITESRACFLLSLMEDLTIDFPSHFITSIIDVYQDIATYDRLIFPSTITRILKHFSIPIPISSLFTIMGAISASFVQWSKAQLRSKRPQVETTDLVGFAIPLSSLAPSSSTASGVTLEAIMEQLQWR